MSWHDFECSRQDARIPEWETMHHCKTLKPAKDDGGGELIASLLDAGQIDEFDIHVIPTFIGEAIPLMARRHRDVTLRPCL